MKASVILVGMPGSGKSTLGVLLAKRRAQQFVDTDLLIQERTGKSLQETVDSEGYLSLRQSEEQVLLESDFSGLVVATGGSAVYSHAGMERLRQFGDVVFLDLPLPELQRRVSDYEQRGIACRPGQSFASLYNERRPLYLRYADIVVDCSHLDHEHAVDAVLAALASQR